MQTWRNDFAYLEKIINILLTVSVVPFKKKSKSGDRILLHVYF